MSKIRPWGVIRTLVLLFVCGRGLAADSGMYRGPENNGIYPETGILRKWPEGGPKLLWKRRLGGTGFSSLTVAGGRVYASAGGMCSVHVFTLDGEEVARIPAGPSTFKRFGGGSRSTTVVRGDVAVTTTPQSDVYALDLMRQERRWAFNVSKEWGEQLGQAGWGYCESPILYGDKVILGATSTRPEDPFLMAFRVDTGEMAWGAGWGEPLDRAHHYQSPSSSAACFNHRGRWLISFTAHSYQTLVEAETGRLLWQIKNRGHHNITPVYRDGYLLWGPNSCWHRDPNEPKLDGLQMMRLSDDGSSYEVLWTRRENLTEFSHAVILDGRVYVYGRPGTPAEKPDPRHARGPIKRAGGQTAAKGGAAEAGDEVCEPPEPPPADKKSKGEFLCLDAKTGALIASHPVSTNFTAPGHVVSADGLVFFLEMAKAAGARAPVPRLAMFEPTANGFEKTGVLDIPVDEQDQKVSEVEWQGRTPPVIAEKRLFVRYGSIFAFDVRAEAPSRGWRQDGAGIAAEATPPIRWSERLNVRWQTDLPIVPAASPVAGPDRVYVLGRNGELVCLDAAGGALRWRRAVRDGAGSGARLEAGAQPTPAVRADRVYAAVREGTVAAFGEDGARLWSAAVEPAPGRAVSSPVLAGRVLAVQGRDLVGFDRDTGAPLWRAPAADAQPYGTPVRIALRGRNLIVTGWGAILNAADGAVVATGLPALLRDSPAVSGAELYFWGRAGKDAAGSRITAVRLSDAGSGALKRATLWERGLPDHAPACSPLATGGLLYALTQEGVLLALDAGTGATCYAQRLRDAAGPADPCAPALVGACGRVYAVNGDGAGGTRILEAGARFSELWSYIVQQGVGEPAFAGDRQYLTAGTRVACIGGTTPVEPRPPELVHVRTLPLQTAPRGAPVEPFADDRIPDAWIFCGPIPGRDLGTDHLASIGGCASATPVAGQEVVAGEAKTAFRALETSHRWRHPQFTADRQALDVTACLDRKFNTTAYFFSVVSNDAPRYVRFGLHTPNGATWNFKERLDARVWIGGERIEETSIVKLAKGFYPMLIQLSIGTCEGHGKIWIGPHFEEVTERYGALMEDYDRVAGVWPDYMAAARSPFTVTACGIQRGLPEGGLLPPVEAASADRPAAERQRLLDELKMRFVAIPGRPYEMQTTEVTQHQWVSLMGSEPWKGQDLTAVGPDYPAVHVSCVEAARCAERLTRMDGAYRYRLPIEAEWRHAAQSGLNGRWCFGSSKSNLTEYAWYGENGEPDRYARPVARLKPSVWGLYDINGNVWEWCGDDLGHVRIAKGGAWFSVDWFCDVQKSPRYGPLFRWYGLGFRLLREPGGGKEGDPQ